MGNGPSSLHQAALAGEIAQVRLAIQEQPGSIDATEPTCVHSCCVDRIWLRETWLERECMCSALPCTITTEAK